MTVAIRSVNAGDFEKIYEFVCALQDKLFDKAIMQRVFNENINSENNIYLIAEVGAIAVGYASCHIQSLLHHAARVAEIQEMYVMPEYRSSGVGKELMKTVKAKAKEKGAVQLEVTTRVIRKEAIKFYVREEFEDTHKKLVHYFKNQEATSLTT
ncbi:MAG: GNAT family N-acetyltransferase [Cyclobacteriaceae bacterium]|nr:GNAT family N-acetyltransferase [Cyclobacteriaceae bacterium]